jgi:hypothetical protein
MAAVPAHIAGAQLVSGPQEARRLTQKATTVVQGMARQLIHTDDCSCPRCGGTGLKQATKPATKKGRAAPAGKTRPVATPRKKR